ncbi:MAG: GxxExxY protein [Myxococcales bacterium]|jgi:GxxExxY protein|nr:GxxExxY protein [Myxococcales bacterium]
MIKEEQDGTKYNIIGCAMKIHRHLGNGFQEVIYQRVLSLEINLRSIDPQREFEIPLFYKGVNIGQSRVVFLISGEMPVEIKALMSVDDTHLTQAMNCLEAYKLRTGLLINFWCKEFVQ